ncbi:MAG: hypothetical protein QQN63_13600 [Nitrosopumilus sp.]
MFLNPTDLKRVKPWEIDLTGLLDMLLSVITKSGKVDLRACGSVVLTSALIYKLKVETFFLLERLRTEKKVGPSGDPPQFLVMPFRYELTTTSIDDLVSSLEDILEDILTHSKREISRQALIEPDPVIQVDPFLTKIRDLLGDFRVKVSGILSDREQIMFFELVHGLDPREVARYFILMLFLATEGLLELEQVGDDIKLSRMPEIEHGKS